MEVAGAKDDAELHAAVGGVLRAARALENEVRRRQGEHLVTWSFRDREVDVRRGR